MNILSKLQHYATGRKLLIPLSLVLSGISALIGLLPYIFIWQIISQLITNINATLPNSVNTYAWLALASAVISMLLYFAALMLAHLVAFRVETNMRRVAMRKLINMPLGFFDKTSSGRIRKIIDDDTSTTHSFLAHQLPDLASSLVIPLATLFLIFSFNWQLGLACLLPITIAFSTMFVMMGGKGKKFQKTYLDAQEAMSSEAVEYVRGIPIVKVFQQTVYSFTRFYKSINLYKEMVIKYTHSWEKPMSFYITIINSFSFFLVPVTILLLKNSGNLTSLVVDLFLYVLITPLFATSIMKSMHLNNSSFSASEAVKRLEKLTDVAPLKCAQQTQKITSHSINLKNVEFKYPNANTNAINNISFSIPEGKTYALVGASGGGKTTIARLIPRFWDVDKGSVSIGSVDVRHVAKDELMNKVAFVFQNTRLFKTTLLENIKYGNPNASAQEIDKVLELAQCSQIISRLPNGLNTKIGTEGTYLSGGEQQRIALARALLKDAPIVVLDEATAFTDPENENLIHQALEQLTIGKTVLMIAHRLTNLVSVDQILVVDKGRIIEQDTHNNLLSKGGVYHNMWSEYQKSVKWTIGKEMKHA